MSVGPAASARATRQRPCVQVPVHGDGHALSADPCASAASVAWVMAASAGVLASATLASRGNGVPPSAEAEPEHPTKYAAAPNTETVAATAPIRSVAGG